MKKTKKLFFLMLIVFLSFFALLLFSEKTFAQSCTDNSDCFSGDLCDTGGTWTCYTPSGGGGNSGTGCAGLAEYDSCSDSSGSGYCVADYNGQLVCANSFDADCNGRIRLDPCTVTSGTCNGQPGECQLNGNYLYCAFTGTPGTCTGGTGSTGGQCSSSASLGTACATSTGATGTCTDIGVCTASGGGFPGTGNGGSSSVGVFNIPTGSQLGMPDPEGGLLQVLTNILLWILTIFGIISIVGFFISGIQYIAASGNEAIIETAKRNIKYSIIGVIVGLSGYIIIRGIYAALTAQTFFF